MKSKIVQTVANIVIPFIVVFGVYLVIHGHLTPGGGFQGGAVIASGFALLLISFGIPATKRKLVETKLSALEAFGLILFITFAFLGLGNSFFYNFLANSGLIFGDPVPHGINLGNLNTAGTLPLMSIAVGLEVLAGLSIILLVFSRGERE